MDWQLSASILCVVPCPMNALSIPSIEDIVPGVEDQNRWVCTVRHFPSAVHIIRIRSIKLACLLEKHYRIYFFVSFPSSIMISKDTIAMNFKMGKSCRADQRPSIISCSCLADGATCTSIPTACHPCHHCHRSLPLRDAKNGELGEPARANFRRITLILVISIAFFVLFFLGKRYVCANVFCMSVAIPVSHWGDLNVPCRNPLEQAGS